MNLLSCLIFSIASATAAGAGPAPGGLPDAARPEELRCNAVKNPLAVDTATPLLGWNLPPLEAMQAQRAYQILVSSSRERAGANVGDLWDSGRVDSGQSQFIPYGGRALPSRQAAYWKVRVWNQDRQVSGWSETNSWRMGLLTESDWTANWIALSEDSNPDSPETHPAPYFRRDFVIDRPVASARAYVCGLGYYELSLNGARAGDMVLAPAPTNYDRRDLRHLLYPYADRSSTRVLYNVIDISKLLVPGENTAGMLLGNGWYNQRDRREEGWMWYDTPRLILQIEIEYEDGTAERVVSDGRWKAATGALLHDGIFTGEIYDARLEPAGWNRPGFDDSGWDSARIVRAPSGRLEAQLAPPDRAVRDIAPVSAAESVTGILDYDFGEMFSGWVRLAVQGEAGTRLTMRYREELGGTYGQEDVYVLRGGGVEQYEPRFTWHAFRHVEIEGLSDAVTVHDVTGKSVHTDVAPAGSFECSNELFNRIYQNYIRTQLGNFHGSFSSDCPHRERLGYTGDGQLLAESSIFSFDMAQFYRKWIHDMADAQDAETGFVPHTAPFGGGGGGPAWGASYVIVPWQYYLYYGDVDILRENYAGMKRFFAYLGTRVDGRGLIVREEPGGWCLGDWAAPDELELPPPFVNTCYLYHLADILSRVAAVLEEEEEDRVQFEGSAEKIRGDINRAYFDAGTKRYWQNRQGAHTFPLAFGIVPAQELQPVLDNLAQSAIANQGHFDTGILATPLMLEVLTAGGREDIAFTLMNQRDYPGFGYILEKDATTLWEYWDGKLSHSHPMYGSVVRWFFKDLAGINPDPERPGFKHTVIKPVLAGDLTHVAATYRSAHGRIASAWTIRDDTLTLNVEIPPNTTATVQVPSSGAESVSALTKTPWGKAERAGRGRKTTNYTVTPGTYEFVSRNIGDLVQPVHVSTPMISPRDSLFLKPESAAISIESATSGAAIHYTLDGSVPDQNSAFYGGPIELHGTTAIRAIAYHAGYLPSFVKGATITFVDPGRNGIAYAVYEGEWDERPDLAFSEPVSRGKTYRFEVGMIEKREDHVAIVFESNLEIGAAGDYTFYSSANDGSVLYLDGGVVVDDAGYFGTKANSGQVRLQPGRHPIRIVYFENTGSESLDVYIEGPGLPKQPIPPDKLFFDRS